VVAPPGDTVTKLNAPAQLQIYPTMSTTVSKFKRIKVNIVSTNFAIQKHHGQTKNHQSFSPLPPGDEVPVRHVNRDDLYHFYASLSFLDSVYSFDPMLGALIFFFGGGALQAKPR